MNLIDFKTYEQSTFRDIQCRIEIRKKMLSERGHIKLVGENHFEMITENGIYKFQIVNDIDARTISDNIRQNKSNLAQAIMSSNDSDIFFIHIVFFYNTTYEGEWNIILSEKVKETIRTKFVRKGRLLEDEIKDNFLLFDGNRHCFAYTNGKYDFTDDKNVKNEYNFNKDTNNEKTNNMLSSNTDELIDNEINNNLKNIKIYGKDYSLLIRLRGEEGNAFLCAEKIDVHNRRIPSMVLGIGNLTFKDNYTFVSEKVRKELEINSGYLDLWEQYARLEGDFLLKNARDIGTFVIDTKKTNRTNEGIVIYPNDLSDDRKRLINSGDSLLFTPNIPVYIDNVNMTWSEYKSYIKDLKNSNFPTRQIIRIDKNGYIVVESGESDNVPEGIISLSIFGNSSQITRRETARDLIANGKSANPALGLIIEGKLSEQINQAQYIKKIEPLTRFVKDKIFKNEPTTIQKKAIEIALNTPDIAIIQGPPGTGKTTVITAIIERLNEISDKRSDNRGQVLITSFQHDAVRNVIERLSVNSLPTIKFGKKGKDDITMEKAIEEWCNKYSCEIKQKNPSIQTTLEEKELAKRHNFYLTSPSDTNALSFLQYAKSTTLNNEIIVEIESIIEDINIRNTEKPNNLIYKIRRLRTTKEGFVDDGCDVAYDLLSELECIMDTNSKENKYIFNVLKDASDCIDFEPSKELLDNLSQVKNDLLKRCIQRPRYKIERPREDILNIYIKIKKSLKKPRNEMDEILFNLLNELENNTVEVENSIAGYNFVYAATTQQSEGKDIRSAKNVNSGEHPTYDTVIIDEAARVNPGDLMIPMSQAKRRIIFVGDHRQLPHIYDEEIFENMPNNDNFIDKDAIKISMFQYIMKKADELYKQDNIKRTITLDAQYRMHPLLGNFVSENFYEPYGECFKSPRPESDFEQPLFNKPLVWVNLPESAGSERKNGTSRIRVCEAEYISNAIKNYINSEQGKNLSYGVITFYSAQVKLIQEKLGNLVDKVRVGSVDAFQGMEFDVIFLSVVRSHKGYPEYDKNILDMDVSNLSKEGEMYKTWDEYRQKIGMKNYGFLTSDNRLCVALSRQKKLLIVVGNASIFYDKTWGNIAEKCVPGMKHLYELCKKEGVLIND